MLRPFAAHHLTDRYVSWLNDPEVVRFSELRHSHHTLETCRRHVADLAAAGHHFWAIEHRMAPHTHVGNTIAYMDQPNRTAEVSILIGDRAARGQALGTEAWCAVVDHLAEQTGVRRVEASTMAANKPMLKVFAASGMRIEGRREGRFLLDSEPVDLVFAGRWVVADRPDQ